MWNKKTFTVLCSLALAGSMAVPAFAAEGICGQEALIAAPYASVVAEKPTVTAGEDLFTRAELVSALHQKAGSPVVNFAMQYTDVEQGAEYAEAIRWASSEKIAGGYGEEKFGPEDRSPGSRWHSFSIAMPRTTTRALPGPGHFL